MMGGENLKAGFLESVFALARRRWRAGAAVFVVVLAGVAAVLLLSRPVYRAEARLRLGEPPPSSGVNPGAGFFGLLRLGGDPFSNDLEVMASRTLTESVVRDEALVADLRAPRGWHRDSLFTSLRTVSETSEAAYEVAWEEGGTVAVRMTAPREDSLRWNGRVGQELEFGGIAAMFRPHREDMPRQVRVKTVPFGEAVRVTSGRVHLERTRRDANVVEIAFDSPDPELARRVVAAVVHRFVELRAVLHRRESTETADSLRTVAAETQAELDRAEQDLEALQRQVLLVDPAAQSEAFVERYSLTVGELEAARAELEAVERLLSRADSAGSASEAWTELVAFPRFLQNQTIGDLLTQLTTLEAERTALALRRTAGNREYQALTDQIAFLDRSLRSVAGSYHKALAEQVGGLERRVTAMDSALSQVPARMVEFGRRQRDVRLLSELMVLTEQRLRQEELRQALTYANVQVIDPPAVLFRPVWPRMKLGAAVGLLLALTFGALAMVVQERADPSVRRAVDIQAALNAPVLAVAQLPRGRAPALADAEVRTVLRSVEASGTGPGLTLAPLGRGTDLMPLSRLLSTNGAPGEHTAGLLGDGGSWRDPTALETAEPRTELPVGSAMERADTPFAGSTAEPGPAPAAESQGRPGRAVDSSTHARPAERVTVVGPLDTLRAASEAAALGDPVVLVVVAGETRRVDLERAAELLDHVGAELAGAIVLCRKPGEVRSVWD